MSQDSAIRRLLSFLRRRVDAWIGRDPDGPLALYSWLWHRTQKDHGRRFLPGPIRFLILAAQDLALYGGWSVMRLSVQVWRRPLLSGGLSLLLALSLWSRESESPIDLQIPHAEISVTALGTPSFQGRAIERDDLPAWLKQHGVLSISLRVDENTPVGLLWALQETARSHGVRRIAFTTDQVPL